MRNAILGLTALILGAGCSGSFSHVETTGIGTVAFSQESSAIVEPEPIIPLSVSLGIYHLGDEPVEGASYMQWVKAHSIPGYGDFNGDGRNDFVWTTYRPLGVREHAPITENEPALFTASLDGSIERTYFVVHSTARNGEADDYFVDRDCEDNPQGRFETVRLNRSPDFRVDLSPCWMARLIYE